MANVFVCVYLCSDALVNVQPQSFKKKPSRPRFLQPAAMHGGDSREHEASGTKPVGLSLLRQVQMSCCLSGHSSICTQIFKGTTWVAIEWI